MKFLKSLKPLLKTQYRPFGMLENYQKKKENEGFEKQLSYFLSKEVYTLAEYKQYVNETIQEQKKGIIKKLFNNDESNQAEMIEQRTILNAFFEEELTEYLKLEDSKKLKEEIALTVGTTSDRVDFVFQNFKQMLYLHTWLNDIKINNGLMPRDQSEMMYRFRKERKIPYFEKIKMKENSRKAREIVQKEMKIKKHKQKLEAIKMKKRQVWKVIKYHHY